VGCWSQSLLKLLSSLLLAFVALALLGRAAQADPDSLASDRPLGPTKIAVTIDDWPENGDAPKGITRASIAQKMIDVLKADGVEEPYGFANGTFMDYDPSEIAILKMWLAAGHPLGNHTYSHSNLNQVGVKAFIEDIDKEDQLLATMEDSTAGLRRRRVFRYPFLEEGNTLAKRNAVRSYLAKNHYLIAEVTSDYFDWAWNAAYNRCIGQHDDKSVDWLETHVVDGADRHLRGVNAVSEYLFNRRIAQILLIHVNAFNSITIDSILKRWKSEGVQFVSLEQALKDPVYHINPNHPYDGGLTFLDEIAESKGLGLGKYDDTVYTIARLNEVCKPPAGAKN